MRCAHLRRARGARPARPRRPSGRASSPTSDPARRQPCAGTPPRDLARLVAERLEPERVGEPPRRIDGHHHRAPALRARPTARATPRWSSCRRRRCRRDTTMRWRATTLGAASSTRRPAAPRAGASGRGRDRRRRAARSSPAPNSSANRNGSSTSGSAARPRAGASRLRRVDRRPADSPRAARAATPARSAPLARRARPRRPRARHQRRRGEATPVQRGSRTAAERHVQLVAQLRGTSRASR